MSQEQQQVVLHITESFGAGTATAIMQFAAATPEASHHLLRRERDDSSASVRPGLFDSVRQLPGGPAAIRAIRRAVREIRPDVVHCHSSIGGALTRVALRSTRSRPILYSPHCYAFQRRDIGLPMRIAYATVEHLLSWNTAATAACSAHEAALASRLNPWRAVQYLPNAALPDPTSDERPATAPVVLTTGRIGPQKDPEFFLRVVEETRRIDDRIQFAWLGSGDADLEDRLRSAGVHVRGWTPRPWDAVADGSVYLHAASWEGFPFAVLEAHAHDLPIVARRIPSFAAAPGAWVSSSPRALAGSVADLLRSETVRRANREDWRSSLRQNDRAHQRAALLALYGSAEGQAA